MNKIVMPSERSYGRYRSWQKQKTSRSAQSSVRRNCLPISSDCSFPNMFCIFAESFVITEVVLVRFFVLLVTFL